MIIFIKQYWKLIVFALLMAGNTVVTYQYVTGQIAKTQIGLISKARKEEQLKQDKVNEINQEQLNELNGVNSRLNDDLKRLRDRAKRMSKDSQKSCKGTTGAELSRPDSEFLTGEAARAERLKSALKACYKYADEVSKNE